MPETTNSARRGTEGRKAVLTARRKYLCMAAGLGLILACAAGLLYALIPRQETVEELRYSYEVTAGAPYRVHLLPNQLYPDAWLAQGLVYPSTLADSIEVTLEAGVAGSAPAQVSGTYEVHAVLQGYQGSDTGSKTVYQKDFLLTKGDIPASSEGSTRMEQVLQVALAPYRQHADQAESILGVSLSRDFSLVFSGVFDIKTTYGDKQEAFSSRLSVPLIKNASLFEITPSDPVQQPGQITEPQEVARPVRAGWVMAAVLMGAAGAALLVFALLFTRRPTADEQQHAQRQQIARKYGSRMIRLAHLPDFGEKERIFIADMESLLLLAEEIRLPVCFCPDARGLALDGAYFIAAPACVYLFRLPHTTLVVEPFAKSTV